jgi:hypothetical protein
MLARPASPDPRDRGASRGIFVPFYYDHQQAHSTKATKVNRLVPMWMAPRVNVRFFLTPLPWSNERRPAASHA